MSRLISVRLGKEELKKITDIQSRLNRTGLKMNTSDIIRFLIRAAAK